MPIIFAFPTFNIVIHQGLTIIIFVRAYFIVSHIVILVILMRDFTSINVFEIYFLMTKILATKAITLKEILIPGCEGSSWWSNSSKISPLLFMIYFLVISFTSKGDFRNNCIDIRHLLQESSGCRHNQDLSW